MKLRIALISLMLSLTACGSSPEERAATAERRQIEVAKKFEEANQLLDAKRYEEAAQVLDKIRGANPVSTLDTLILFNSGIAYQSMGQCETAGERYRQVIRLTAKTSPKINTLARLRLSDIYICLGDDNKATLGLVEVYRHRKNLPLEVGEAEVPARLAAAYARLGNKNMADRYFKYAEMGLAKVRVQGQKSKEQREMMARTLFLMGNISQLKTENMSSSDYFATVESLQKYLYRAVEMNVQEWSEQAAQQLREAYAKTWNYLDSVEPLPHEDEVRGRRDMKAQKVGIARRALAALRGLYRERVPSPEEPAAIRDLLSQMRREEAKIQSYIALHTPGSERTLEAEQVESVRQKGRVANPDPSLERNKK